MNTTKASYFSVLRAGLLAAAMGAIALIPVTGYAVDECAEIKARITSGDYADEFEYEDLLDWLERCEISQGDEEDEDAEWQ